MADRRVFARLRITPCGLFDSSAHTITLEQIDGAFFIAVVERDLRTRKQSRRRMAISAAAVQEQWDALKKCTVPAFPVSPMVCDGEYVELTIKGEQSTLTLGWWTIAPEGAQPVATFADWLREEGLDHDEND